MTREEEVVRAGHANEVLTNRIFKEAVSEIEEALKHARMSSAIKDTDLREKLWAQEVALHSILQKLRSVMETGELAQEQIRQAGIIEKAKKLFRVN